MQIKIDTDDNGVLWLTGTARTKEAADKAHAIARATEGVEAEELYQKR